MTRPRDAGTAGNRPLDILIVDDEREGLTGLARFCEARGFRPRPFSDARTALRAIHEGLSPDLVISDYRMPGMDGLQFVDQLRADRIAVPIIVLTAHGDIDAYFRFFSLGVFEFVHKPVRESELERIVRTALRRGGVPAAPR